jgi:hypothetical protein
MNWLRRSWLPEDETARRSVRWAAGVTGLLLVAVVVLLYGTRVSWLDAAAKVVAKGKTPRVEVVALGWMWKALLVDGVLLAGLFLTVPWWAKADRKEGGPLRGDRKEPCVVGGPQSGRRRWVIGGLVLGVFAVALYNDEAHNYARLWSGLWEQGGAGPVLDVPRWGETLFLNGAGNNSQPFSILARVCLEGARKGGWSVPGEVTEWVVRLPSLGAGLISIWLIGLLARRRLGDVGMVWTMLALALHPWHIRYSTEARGHGLMVLGIVMLLLFADRAFESGRWRHWGGYAAGLFLCATAFLGSIYFLVCVSAGLFVYQAWRWRKSGDWSLITRPLVASLGASMAGLVLILPMIPQLLLVLENFDSIRGVMGLTWWKDVGGYLMAGTRWVDADPANPVNQALSRWVGWTPFAGAVVCWCLVMSVGMLALGKAGGVMRVLVWATPAALVLAWFLMSRKGNFLNHWYVLFAVPCVVLALGAGAVRLGRWQRGVGWLVVLGALMVPGRVAVALRGLEKQNERGPVIDVLGATYPRNENVTVRPLLAAFWCNANLYHPDVFVVRETGDLEAVMAKARSEGRELFVCFSHRGPALKSNPDLVSKVEDERVFNRVKWYYGQEESQFTMHLFKLRP